MHKTADGAFGGLKWAKSCTKSAENIVKFTEISFFGKNRQSKWLK